MKEAYGVIYHILLFLVVKIDYFFIDFHFYDILQVLNFFGTFLLVQIEKVPIYCENLRFHFLKNQNSNSYCTTTILNEK